MAQMGTGTWPKEVLTRGLLQGLLMATFHGAHLPKHMKRHPGQTYREHKAHTRQSCSAGGGATPTGLAGCAPTSCCHIGLQPPSTNSCHVPGGNKTGHSLQNFDALEKHMSRCAPAENTCNDTHAKMGLKRLTCQTAVLLGRRRRNPDGAGRLCSHLVLPQWAAAATINKVLPCATGHRDRTCAAKA